MKFVAMRELRNNTSRLLDRLAEEDVVLTRNGKPAAALVYLDEDLLVDFIIGTNRKLLSELKSARREYARKGGISHQAMKRKILSRRG